MPHYSPSNPSKSPLGGVVRSEGDNISRPSIKARATVAGHEQSFMSPKVIETNQHFRAQFFFNHPLPLHQLLKYHGYTELCQKHTHRFNIMVKMTRGGEGENLILLSP